MKNKRILFTSIDGFIGSHILSSFKGTEWNGERVSVEKSKAPGSPFKKDDRRPTKERKNFRERKNSKTKGSRSKAKKGSFKDKFQRSKKRS